MHCLYKVVRPKIKQCHYDLRISALYHYNPSITMPEMFLPDTYLTCNNFVYSGFHSKVKGMLLLTYRVKKYF